MAKGEHRQTGDDDEKLAGKTRWRKRLNSYKALAIQDSDLSFTGMKADNDSRFRKNEFASDQSTIDDGDDVKPENKISSFAKKIQTHIGKQGIVVPNANADTAIND